MRQTPDKFTATTKRKKYRYIILAILLLLFLTFVIVGIFTDWFGLYGPVSKIAIAGAKTFHKQNFSADFEIGGGRFHADGFLQLNIDTECDTLEAYMEATSGKTVYIAAIYDFKLIYGTQKHLFSKDITAQLENFFRESENKPPKIRSIDDALDVLFNLFPEEIQKKISDKYIDLDKSKDLLKSFIFKKFNRTSWLKDHFAYDSYEVEGVRYHRFRSDKGALLSDILEHFDPAFVNEDLFNRLSTTAETMQASDSATETLIAIEDGFLIKYETITHTPEKTTYMSLKFHHIGTTELDQEHLRDLLTRSKS